MSIPAPCLITKKRGHYSIARVKCSPRIPDDMEEGTIWEIKAKGIKSLGGITKQREQNSVVLPALA